MIVFRITSATTWIQLYIMILEECDKSSQFSEFSTSKYERVSVTYVIQVYLFTSRFVDARKSPHKFHIHERTRFPYDLHGFHRRRFRIIPLFDATVEPFIFQFRGVTVR